MSKGFEKAVIASKEIGIDVVDYINDFKNKVHDRVNGYADPDDKILFINKAWGKFNDGLIGNDALEEAASEMEA